MSFTKIIETSVLEQGQCQGNFKSHYLSYKKTSPSLSSLSNRVTLDLETLKDWNFETLGISILEAFTVLKS